MKQKITVPSGFKEVVGDPNVFQEEGFVIKTSGNSIVLGGNSDGPYQGTIYAGTMIATVPLVTKFRRDLHNEGVLAEWYRPQFDDRGWGTKNTFLLWDQQDKPEDAQGHDYDGYGWYRFTVNVPADAVNRPLKLHLGGVINEGWAWINGEYAGHRKWLLWWSEREPLEMDVDVTGKVKAGDNVVAVRVWNNADVGGLHRRGFLWSPK
jgi:hypothetical protein